MQLCYLMSSCVLIEYGLSRVTVRLEPVHCPMSVCVQRLLELLWEVTSCIDRPVQTAYKR